MGVMESCTGGAIANCITNIPGSSDVFECGLVTYCNKAKIKAGVSEKIIDKFGVYSIEVAEEMARKVGHAKNFAFRRINVGVGVAGNLPGDVFVAIQIEKKVESRKFKIESKPTSSRLRRVEENEIEGRKEMKVKVVEKVVEIPISNV